MQVIEGVEGNVESDPDLTAARDRHREHGTLEHLRIDDTQRQRSRFRATTDAGRELGVVVPGTDPLAPGDVLLEGDVMIVVELARVQTLAVQFPPDTEPGAAALVGHAAGNRHWDLTIDSGTVHVPAGPDPDARRRTLDGIVPDGVSVESAELPPSAFDETPDHSAHEVEQATQGASDRDEHDHGEHEHHDVSGHAESDYGEHDHGEHEHHDVSDHDEHDHHDVSDHDEHDHGVSPEVSRDD